jgi:hypothetical protein
MWFTGHSVQLLALAMTGLNQPIGHSAALPPATGTNHPGTARHWVRLTEPTCSVVKFRGQGVQLVRFATSGLYHPIGQRSGAAPMLGRNQPGAAIQALMLVLMKGDVKPTLHERHGRETSPRVTTETP